jgi:hypothetical protein
MGKKRREDNNGPAATAWLQLRAGADFQIPAGVLIVVAQLHRHTELTRAGLTAAGIEMPSEAIADCVLGELNLID